MIDLNELKKSGSINEKDLVMVKQKGRPLPVDGYVKDIGKTFITISPIKEGENAEKMAQALERIMENAELDEVVVASNSIEYIMKLTIRPTDSETENKDKETT